MFWQTVSALGQTLLMVSVSSLIAVIAGIPLGVFLLITRKGHLFGKPSINWLLAGIVNIIRSIPFIILMVAIIPLTRFITGTTIGTAAAIVPLAITAIPFVARLVETALDEVPHGLIEAAHSMGATTQQIITKVLLREARAGIIQAITLTVITLVGYSAMAGAVGGGGLGDLAIRYGYQRFEPSIMIATIIILVFLVQIIQSTGDFICQKLNHSKRG